ncbi:transposase [Parageobacillus sp. SY1]|nr:transposase [Parageobacillus sp. SY1]
MAVLPSQTGAGSDEGHRSSPRYRGTIMHDAWAPYFLFTEAEHALCNAHLFRELRALHEVHQQGWTRRLSDLLLEPARQRSWRSAHRRASPGARSGMGPPCPTSRFVGAFAAPQRIRNGGQGNQKAPSPFAGTENGDPSIFAGTACAV